MELHELSPHNHWVACSLLRQASRSEPESQEVANTLAIEEQGRLSLSQVIEWPRAQSAEEGTDCSVSQMFSSVVSRGTVICSKVTSDFIFLFHFTYGISCQLVKCYAV